MSATHAIVQAAEAGALCGAAGGAIPLILGLYGRNSRKAVVGMAVCVLAGAIGGTYAVIPVCVSSSLAIVRGEQKRRSAEGPGDLVFKYSRQFVWLTFVGLALVALLAIILLGLSLFSFTLSGGGVLMRLQAAFLGLLGIAFGWVASFSIRNWYVPLSEFALTSEGVTITYRNSSRFVPWECLVSAQYRRAIGQLDLEFNGFTRRVVVSNADFDPRRENVLRAVALVESVSGHSVRRTMI